MQILMGYEVCLVKSNPVHCLNPSIRIGSQKQLNISAEWTSTSLIRLIPLGENGNSFLIISVFEGHLFTSYSVFETNIRFVGGLLSAYELSNYTYPVLLQKAQQVADKLSYAWVGVSQRSFRVRSSRPDGSRTMLFHSDT